jgi:hypothetical protein
MSVWQIGSEIQALADLEGRCNFIDGGGPSGVGRT